MNPESAMMSAAYDAKKAENSIKTPIYQSSTYAFNSAEEGKRFFEIAYGLKEAKPGEKAGLIYSRMDHPNANIAEQRLAIWDKAEAGALFSSGMGAITCALMAFLKPGDALLYSTPLYGGSVSLIQNILVNWGISVIPFPFNASAHEIDAIVEKADATKRLKMIYIESPANPTNALLDISICAGIAQKYSQADHRVLLAMDNTYLGPYWQNPHPMGVDLVLYSATKYIGGHSDLLAGACMGSAEDIAQVKYMRAMFGPMIDPNTAWLIQRSLETLAIRCRQQEANAKAVVQFLAKHPKVKQVMYPGFGDDEAQKAIFKKQCHGSGAMISFELFGGEADAFQFLNTLKLIKLAVSLGSTESLAQHPYTMTHSAVEPKEKREGNITPGLIRLSVGVEHADDLIADLGQALG